MSYRKVILVLISISIVLVSLSIRASEKTPLAHATHLVQKEFINIDSKKIATWLEVERGGRIALPWFEGSVLPVTIEKTRISDHAMTPVTD